ncbi:MAG: response regulator [Candidatus Margulisiibacteriota bacterium]
MQKNDRILVVDDEQVIRDLLERTLTEAGYGVKCVTNGQDGLQNVAQDDFGLVFLDLKMPKMSGMEVLQRIKELNKKIEVIIITGFASLETAIIAVKKDAFAYLQKPLSIDEIVSQAEKALEKRKLSQQLDQRVAKLERLKNSLQEEVAGKVLETRNKEIELDRLYKATVDRELAMKKLEEQISTLKQKLENVNHNNHSTKP